MAKPLKWVAIAIGVVLLAIVAMYLLGYLDLGTESTDVWTPQEGDYLEYDISVGEAQYTMRIEIVEVTSTTMTINTTTTMVGSGHPYSVETEVPLNQTLGFSYDLSNPPQGMTITDLGVEEIDTNWGWKSANRFFVSYSDLWGQWDADIWVYKGVLLKLYISHLPENLTLVETNLRPITHG